MDTNTALLGTGTSGTILGVLILLYKTFNHKKLRSNCCGNKMEVSLDIDDTSPPQERFEVNNPLPIAVVVR